MQWLYNNSSNESLINHFIGLCEGLLFVCKFYALLRAKNATFEKYRENEAMEKRMDDVMRGWALQTSGGMELFHIDYALQMRSWLKYGMYTIVKNIYIKYSID